MSTQPKTYGLKKFYTVDLPYDNDLDQDELNRRLRKPGEPGYVPPPDTPDAADSTAEPQEE